MVHAGNWDAREPQPSSVMRGRDLEASDQPSGIRRCLLGPLALGNRHNLVREKHRVPPNRIHMVRMKPGHPASSPAFAPVLLVEFKHISC